MANEQSAFLPVNPLFDNEYIQSLNVESDEFKKFLITLIQNMTDIATIVNMKDSGYYIDSEFITGQLFVPDPNKPVDATVISYRPVFRKAINTGALLNGVATIVPHGIAVNASYKIVRIYGAATDTTNPYYIPLPFVNVTNTPTSDDIELYADGTNIVITPAGNASNFNESFVVLEYIKR